MMGSNDLIRLKELRERRETLEFFFKKRDRIPEGMESELRSAWQERANQLEKIINEINELISKNGERWGLELDTVNQRLEESIRLLRTLSNSFYPETEMDKKLLEEVENFSKEQNDADSL